MKARVNRDLCLGSAMCTSIAPQVFELDNQGLSRVVDSGAGTDGLLREAAENYPGQAIMLEDDEGNQVYP